MTPFIIGAIIGLPTTIFAAYAAVIKRALAKARGDQ